VCEIIAPRCRRSKPDDSGWMCRGRLVPRLLAVNAVKMRATSRRSVRFKLDGQVNVRALGPRVPGRERRTHDRGTISEGKQGSLTIVPLSLALPCYSFWLFRAATHELGNRNDFIIPAETIGVTYPASLRHSGPTRPPSPMCIALLGLWDRSEEVSRQTMPDPIRCPYCVQCNHFKVMTEEEGGLWFKCAQCGHLVSLGSPLTKCNCSNCFAIEHSISRRTTRFTVSLQGRGY
jgi:hypothetical protein